LGLVTFSKTNFLKIVSGTWTLYRDALLKVECKLTVHFHECYYGKLRRERMDLENPEEMFFSLSRENFRSEIGPLLQVILHLIARYNRTL
jgi:hypothetical protein